MVGIWNISHRQAWLNIWFTAGVAVWILWYFGVGGEFEEVCHWGLTAQIALPTSCLLSAYSLWIQCDWLPPTAIAMWPFYQHGLSSMIGYEQWTNTQNKSCLHYTRSNIMSLWPEVNEYAVSLFQTKYLSLISNTARLAWSWERGRSFAAPNSPDPSPC